MGRFLITSVATHLRRYFTRRGHRRDTGGFLLFLRMENVGLITELIGQSGISHIFAQILLGLKAAGSATEPVRNCGPGIFVALINDKSEGEAKRIAKRLQQQGQHPLTIGGQSITPVLTGLLLPNSVIPTAESADPILRGQTLIATLKNAHPGEVTMMDLPPGAVDATPPVTICESIRLGQIVARFQPRLSCDSGQVTAFEANPFWTHPTPGHLAQDKFPQGMSDADDFAITVTMLRQSLDALVQWEARDENILHVSLRVSQIALADGQFPAMVLQELSKRGLAPGRLMLDISQEQSPIIGNRKACSVLKHLNRAGCLLALDDFGTGNANLDTIRTLGIHCIKLDQSFILGCDVDSGQERVVLATLALAEMMDMRIIAKGVKTQSEHAHLAQLGCDEVQGGAVGKPMPLHDSFDFLTRQHEKCRTLPVFPTENSD